MTTNKRRRIINTNNREIYEKFNMLNISDAVTLVGVKPFQVKRIINTINRGNMNVLSHEKIGEYIVVRRMNPINFSIYFKRKQIYI